MDDDDDDMPTLCAPIVWRKIQKSFNSERHGAVTLLVNETTSYTAHPYLLSVSSDVFEAMLTRPNWNESHQSVIKLQEDNPSCVEVFPTFLEYFYSGTAFLNQSNIMPILILADKYSVTDLADQCIHYMYCHLSEAAEDGKIISWFQYVESVNQPLSVDELYYCRLWQIDDKCVTMKEQWSRLYKALKNFIKWNLELCVDSFISFDFDILVGLLKQSDIVVFDEMKLFGYVVSWLDNKSTESSLKLKKSHKRFKNSLIKDVMKYIRFPMMLPWQTAQLLTTSIVTENKEFFMPKMAAAMQYHTVKTEPGSTIDYLTDCTPRIYTSENWGDSYRVFFKDYHQTVTFQKCSRISLFDKGQEHEESEWILKFSQTPILKHAEILKAVQIKVVREGPAEVLHRHTRATILVHTFQKRIPTEFSFVSSILQNVVDFESNECWVCDEFIVCDKISNVEELDNFMANRVPMKFNIIITPIVLGLTDSTKTPLVQHVLDDYYV